MFTFLLVIHAIIAAALVGVILMQRSEGGGLGMGGSPSGLMSARGAADFLTRATTILATIFVVLSIGLATLATVQRAPRKIDDSLAVQPGTAPETGLIPAAPPANDPLAAAAAAGSASGNGAEPAPAIAEPAVKAPAAATKAAAVPAPATKAPVTTPPATKAPATAPRTPAATIPTVTVPPRVAPTAPANGSTPSNAAGQ